jgi:hypothetical protein
MRKLFFIIIVTIFTHSVYSQDTLPYIENELIIWLEEGVDAAEFATNSDLNIAPKRVLVKSLNVWLFEFTDAVAQRSKNERNRRKSSLSSNVNVKIVQNNHTNITLRGITPDDPYYENQWAPAKIRLPDA